jgi:hypothetical protein
MIIRMAIIILGLPLTLIATAQPQRIECPTEIPQQSIRLSDTAHGWTSYVATPLYLHSAGAAGAAPEKLATLVGNTHGRPSKTGEWRTIYTLEGPYPEGKWMECGYGESNQIILSKRLDEGTRECTVTYQRGEKAGQNNLRIICE